MRLTTLHCFILLLTNLLSFTLTLLLVVAIQHLLDIIDVEVKVLVQLSTSFLLARLTFRVFVLLLRIKLDSFLFRLLITFLLLLPSQSLQKILNYFKLVLI